MGDLNVCYNKMTQTDTVAGAAHGLSAILQMLLCFPDFVKSAPGVEQEVKASVDFMLSLMQPNGNIAPAMDEVHSRDRPESEELVHWCHGAPGLYCLMKYKNKDKMYINCRLSKMFLK